ncbi:hypothetical protein [Polynucleobacter sp. UB-Piko-W3]|nr:hypothetical protein [Polynucleobacter sp. UB-Piko-W3]MBU3554826.1 hypothetical protein [Polynucleobacter sp. UB-Piko-W3]
MGISAGVAMGAGALTSAFGAQSKADSQKMALEGQAYMDDTNARLAELSAQSALLSGQRQEASIYLKRGQMKSTQRTALAANGIDLTSPTAQNILTTTDVMGEVDANTAKANAIRNAWGYRTEGMNYTNKAITARGNASAINPDMAFATSLLGSSTSAAKDWYLLNKAGAFA